MNLLEVFSKPSTNKDLPPGLDDIQIMSLDEFLKSELNENEAEDLIRGRQSGKIQYHVDSEQPIIHRKNIVDEKGNPLSIEELKKKFSERPNKILNQNKKLGKSGGKIKAFYNVSLPAYKGLYHDEKTDELKIVTTCPLAGSCKATCFARKGNYIQYEHSSLKNTRLITFLLNDWNGFKNQLIYEIKTVESGNNEKGIETVIRWHDTGDFFNQKYLNIAYEIARETPEVLHYAYTKSIPMVSASKPPKNFIFTFSMGGKKDVETEKSKKRVALIVPSDVFLDSTHKIPIEGDKKNLKMVFNSPKAEKEVKNRLAVKYNIDEKKIITYDELMDKEETDSPIYFVIVKGGDGDDAATRKDVAKILLFFH